MIKKKIVVITGPTAVGKTELSLTLSQNRPIEIISADSRQIYKYLDIGTAKPNAYELAIVKHHLIDLLEPDQYFSAGKFQEIANELILSIFQNDNFPIIVGGTGLYIKALIDGLFKEDVSYNKEEIKSKINSQIEIYGNVFLLNELQKIDPEILELYTDYNPRRLFRALEYYYGTGKKFSESITSQKNNFDYDFLYLVIADSRENIYDRINQRVHKMWESGLVDETKRILDMGFSRDLNSLNTVGYKEVIDYLDRKIDKDKTIELIQQNTRRYAKRQFTWFKGVENAVWLDKRDSNFSFNFPMIIDQFLCNEGNNTQKYQNIFNNKYQY